VSADAFRRIAVVPAYNEEQNIARVVAELKEHDPGLDVVVVSDGSVDRTDEAARGAGAKVLCLPFNLGIGGAVQTGFRYAWENGYELAVRCDGDGQHVPAELPKVIAPVVAGDADIAIGSRFVTSSGYRSSATRRVGIRLLALVVSTIARQRVTDATSGFQALNRRALELFAADYPHDYPEVEGMVMTIKHRLRLVEVPVEMREREHGRSSITALRSIYYMVKVLTALFVGLFRRSVVPLETSRRLDGGLQGAEAPALPAPERRSA
jgi:glycosyltransferase involved in cell wall biosynthesis